MDRDVWTNVMDAVGRAIAKLKPSGRKPKYSHRLVAGMYLWSVWHDRSLSWACDRAHYGDLFRPRALPSISRFSRRVKQPVFRRLLQRVHDDLAASGLSSPVLYVDGKPLTVSPVSKDPDARSGHVTGGFAKGYRLHAYVSEGRRIVVWSLAPLNAAEQTVAALLSAYLPPAPSPDALVMGDSNFDAAPLHKALGALGWPLLTPLKAQQRVKGGVRHPVTLRQMGPQRREAIAVDEACPRLKQLVLKRRNNVEGTFSVLAAAGLSYALPTFVRRIERVRRWVGAKIILYHAKLRAQERAAASAAA
jgi:hypothetical protein